MSICEMASAMKLSYIRDNHALFIQEARHLNMDYQVFLETLLKNELKRRSENSTRRRIRNARFPLKKYLEDFDHSKYNPDFPRKFQELESLAFIDNKENIILIGAPGAGKTHYAIALGTKACLTGKSVLFVSVPNLIIELKEAMSQNQLTVYKRKFEKFDLVILD